MQNPAVFQGFWECNVTKCIHVNSIWNCMHGGWHVEIYLMHIGLEACQPKSCFYVRQRHKLIVQDVTTTCTQCACSMPQAKIASKSDFPHKLQKLLPPVHWCRLQPWCRKDLNWLCMHLKHSASHFANLNYLCTPAHILVCRREAHTQGAGSLLNQNKDHTGRKRIELK